MAFVRGTALAFALMCSVVAHGHESLPPVQTTPAAAPDRWTLIYAGTLMTDVDKPVQRDMSIMVKNGVVAAIRSGRVRPQDVAGVSPETIKTIDLGSYFVMAGLIDAHVHLGSKNDLVEAMKQAREKLVGGATTVRDAGSAPEVIFPLRDAINAGYVSGPRILASGALISTTGGHGDTRNGNFGASLEPPSFSSGVCDGVAECLKVTRRQIQLGADQIKLVATAGVTDNSDTGLEQQFSDDEIDAIIGSAHLMKRKVMAHAIGAEGIKAVVRANVDSIEHGNELDEVGAKLMQQHGTYLVPTLSAPADVLRRIRSPRPGDKPLSENTVRKVERMPEAQPGAIGRQVRMARKFGVKLGVGTDFAGTPSSEMVLLVRNGGITPMQALYAATKGNADLLGISSTVGTLEPGKSADIVAFEGDPREQIENATKVRFVMSQGREASDHLPAAR